MENNSKVSYLLQENEKLREELAGARKVAIRPSQLWREYHQASNEEKKQIIEALDDCKSRLLKISK